MIRKRIEDRLRIQRELQSRGIDINNLKKR